MNVQYKDIVTKSGRLRDMKYILPMITEDGAVGVSDLIEQMHKMIWSLADHIAGDQYGAAADPKLYVDSAAEDAVDG